MDKRKMDKRKMGQTVKCVRYCRLSLECCQGFGCNYKDKLMKCTLTTRVNSSWLNQKRSQFFYHFPCQLKRYFTTLCCIFLICRMLFNSFWMLDVSSRRLNVKLSRQQSVFYLRCTLGSIISQFGSNDYLSVQVEG